MTGKVDLQVCEWLQTSAISYAKPLTLAGIFWLRLLKIDLLAYLLWPNFVWATIANK